MIVAVFARGTNIQSETAFWNPTYRSLVNFWIGSKEKSLLSFDLRPKFSCWEPCPVLDWPSSTNKLQKNRTIETFSSVCRICRKSTRSGMWFLKKERPFTDLFDLRDTCRKRRILSCLFQVGDNVLCIRVCLDGWVRYHQLYREAAKGQEDATRRAAQAVLRTA